MKYDLSNSKLLSMILFKDNGKPLKFYDYQYPIFKAILKRFPKRNYCRATTQAGKSFVLGYGIAALAGLTPNRKIGILAPTSEQYKIIMNYVVDAFLNSEYLISKLPLSIKGMGAEKLKKELTKTKLTLFNGSSIQCISADIKGKGTKLIGHGFSDLFIDELESIPVNLIKTKVMRMLGKEKDSFIFCLSNPIKRGYGYEKLHDVNWNNIKIGWRECVEAGRFTKEFIEERKKDMTELQFRIWFESEYPDKTENQLIKRSDIEHAVRKSPEIKEIPLKLLGVDVARFGSDLTVLVYVEVFGGLHVIKEIHFFSQIDTMNTASKVIELEERIGFNKIIVDDVGVGGGVFDALNKREGFQSKIIAFNGGNSPPKLYKEKFINQKAFYYNQLNVLFEQGNIIIPNHQQLIRELEQIKVEFPEAGKMKVVKAEEGEKSPDFADALMMACSNLSKGKVFVLEGI